MKSSNDIISNPLEYYSPKEVAEYFSISWSAVKKWMSKGKIEFKMVSGVRIIKGQWVIDYLYRQNNKNDFKSLAKILEDYKLPSQRNE